MTLKAEFAKFLQAHGDKLAPPEGFASLCGYDRMEEMPEGFLDLAWNFFKRDGRPMAPKEILRDLQALVDQTHYSLVDNIRSLIAYMGDNPERDGLIDTPQRVLESYTELFSGYQVNVPELFTTFDYKCDEMVVLRDVEFYSTCEHHMLPFIGKAHIAYIPIEKVVGISKLVRLLEAFSRRLQIQERIGNQVTTALDEHLRPRGSACILEAKHLCMTCRGVNKQDSVMITSSLTGAFREDARARAELFSMIRG